MKNLYYIILFFGVFLLGSCEKEADLETPSYSPKLVIHSFISPNDTILKVHVSANKNIFGQLKEYPASLPVSVFMFDGEEKIEFSSRDSLGFCFSKHKIMPGKEYRLLVKCAGYPDATASCKVPQVKDFKIEIDTTSEFINYEYDPYYPRGPLDPQGFYDQKVIVKFSDIAGEPNFYNVLAYKESERLYGVQIEILYPETQDGNHNYDYSYYSSNKIISDKLRDGKDIQLRFRNYYLNNDTTLYSLELTAVVLETDADYNKYHTSLGKYSGTDQPFTEYSPLYTNVSGGLGIFASYNRYTGKMKLK